ncbi:hypothetical protein GLOIN_2v1783866 [Rhizophagus clarus]|uniref:C2H2-type domain-containing protein n=1 Tax=Rhizophagus clarus TaxID=94130 RepID=A0A8H3LDJ1_9GLOM|nr:hypothetical protein GLOIN_2v1783866 [Rhizophagus clarus]
MNKERELPPLPFIIINNTECFVCKKNFKSIRGFFQHKSIIRKYNKIPEEQEKIPSFLINKFKETIVYLIHRRLGKKNTGLQTVSMDCPVDLFKKIFENYIHYYTKKTGALKCVFRGSTGDQNQEENSLNKLRLKKATKNLKYSYGEVIIKWKGKKDIDAKKNVCNGVSWAEWSSLRSCRYDLSLLRCYCSVSYYYLTQITILNQTIIT